MKAPSLHIFKNIETLIKELKPEGISAERKAILQPLGEYIQTKVANHQAIRLHFICTHNSRRSHLSQVWAQALAYYFNIEKVACYSGGTESTAVYPVVIDTLRNAGFGIQMLSEGKNPIYSIKYAANEPPILGFSKRLDNDFNPKSGFAVIMTCDSANEACPFVSGAEKRFPIMYEDPKAYDKTSQQTEKYQERSLQIATELFYVFSQIDLKG